MASDGEDKAIPKDINTNMVWSKSAQPDGSYCKVRPPRWNHGPLSKYKASTVQGKKDLKEVQRLFYTMSKQCRDSAIASGMMEKILDWSGEDEWPATNHAIDRLPMWGIFFTSREQLQAFKNYLLAKKKEGLWPEILKEFEEFQAWDTKRKAEAVLVRSQQDEADEQDKKRVRKEETLVELMREYGMDPSALPTSPPAVARAAMAGTGMTGTGAPGTGGTQARLVTPPQGGTTALPPNASVAELFAAFGSGSGQAPVAGNQTGQNTAVAQAPVTGATVGNPNLGIAALLGNAGGSSVGGGGLPTGGTLHGQAGTVNGVAAGTAANLVNQQGTAASASSTAAGGGSTGLSGQSPFRDVADMRFGYHWVQLAILGPSADPVLLPPNVRDPATITNPVLRLVWEEKLLAQYGTPQQRAQYRATHF